MKENSKTQKPVQQKEKNPIADMIIWNQTIEKENKNIKLYTKFHITPSNIYQVTDKIGIDPDRYFIQSKKTKVNKELDSTVQSYLNRCFDVPKNKYPYPLSEAQEIGWYHDYPGVKPFKRHEIKCSDETTFDNAYAQLTGYSQFSKKAKQITLNDKADKKKP